MDNPAIDTGRSSDLHMEARGKYLPKRWCGSKKRVMAWSAWSTTYMGFCEKDLPANRIWVLSLTRVANM